MDCQICLEILRQGVECLSCHSSACRKCTQKYLYDVVTPKCMFCKADWDLEFVAMNTDPKFHNEKYRERRMENLLEQEKGLLLSTQPDVKALIQQKKLDEQRASLRKELILLEEVLMDAEERKEQEPYAYIEIDLYKAMIRFLKGKLKERKDPEFVVEKFSGFCPAEKCRGFLDSKGVCGICSVQACPECRTVHKGDCDKGILESIRQIEKNCKPCPDCKAYVFKISGCDQMFCVKSNTFFSWESGLKIDPKIKHNPHYYEYKIRNAPKNAPAPDTGKCHGFTLDELLSIQDKIRSHEFTTLIRWFQIVEHYRDVVLRKYRTTEYNSETYKDLRIKYLMNELSEKDWLSALKKLEKGKEKNRAVYLVLSMFIDTMKDVIGSVAQPGKDSEDVISEIYALVNYTNKSLEKIGERFGNKVLRISEDI